MFENSAALARSITWNGSKQSYFTTRFLVDKALETDCYRAYAYFRWVDDVIDIYSETRDERISFIKRQKRLINLLYENVRPEGLSPEEEIIADLINHDKGVNSGLQSFIRNFLAVIEFDAYRKGRLINEQDLNWYSSILGKSVTDAIQYFIKNGYPYPDGNNRYLAATAAHITHMLRDLAEDINEGYFNIPLEYLDDHEISLDDLNNPLFRAWVRERVKLARKYFRLGKIYLDGLDVLRCKLAGYWYCARFESVLDKIEQNNYLINNFQSKHNEFFLILKMILLGVTITIQHFSEKILRIFVNLPTTRAWRRQR